LLYCFAAVFVITGEILIGWSIFALDVGTGPGIKVKVTPRGRVEIA
jgi:hypothetical protein